MIMTSSKCNLNAVEVLVLDCAMMKHCSPCGHWTESLPTYTHITIHQCNNAPYYCQHINSWFSAYMLSSEKTPTVKMSVGVFSEHSVCIDKFK